MIKVGRIHQIRSGRGGAFKTRAAVITAVVPPGISVRCLAILSFPTASLSR